MSPGGGGTAFVATEANGALERVAPTPRATQPTGGTPLET